MKLFKRVLSGVALAASLVVSAQASVITVQGVSWDPDATSPTNPVTDFQASNSLTQWYQTAANGLAFNPTGGVVSFTTPGSLLNTYVTGAGKLFTINGTNQVVNDPMPETTPAVFAPGREVTFIYGGIKISGVNLSNPLAPIFTFDLTKSYINVYSDAPNYTESSSSLAEQLDAANTNLGSPFLLGHFDAFSLNAFLLTTGSLAGFADGLISVDGGAAFGNFDTNGITNPFTGVLSDLSFTGSSQIDVGSNISKVASGELAGNTVPEPGSLALLGMAIFAAGAVSRRRNIKG